MYYTVYKITNMINNKIYVGIHKTSNLEDDYMGSGKMIQRAIEKYGIENFEKEYLAIFDNSDDMFEMETDIVNESFLDRDDTYNLKLGGEGGFDHLKGKFVAVDENGDKVNITHNDPRYISGKLKSIHKGFVTVRTDDNDTLRVSIDDPRYLSGELKHNCVGKNFSEEHRRKISEASSMNQLGTKNHQYGTCWIYNKVLNQNKKIKKEELDEWIDKGWSKGRNIKKNS